MKPDFLGIGAQKAGTKWLYDQLKPHPGVYLTPIKEIHYWDIYRTLKEEGRSSVFYRLSNQKWQRHLGKALNFEQRFTAKWFFRFFLGDYSEKWYESLFTEADTQQVKGEITPEYSTLSVDTIRDIQTFNPELKMIYLLRNPVGRAWSSFKMYLRRNKLSLENLNEDEVYRHLNDENMKNQGDYASCLKNWYSVFDEERMLVHYIEEIKKEPMVVMQSVCRHLGLSDEYLSENLAQQVSHEGHQVEFDDKYKDFLKEKFNTQNQALFDLTGNPIVKSWME